MEAHWSTMSMPAFDPNASWPSWLSLPPGLAPPPGLPDPRCPHKPPKPAKPAKPPGFEFSGWTAMIRNIPCKFSREGVAAELNFLGLEVLCDDVFVPRHAHTRGNLGYCFVSFPSESAFLECRGILHGSSLGECGSKKTCEVTLADPHSFSFDRKAVRKARRMAAS